MNIDIDRFEGEALEPEIAFPCDNWRCKNFVREGQKYFEVQGRRVCYDCGQHYIDGVEKIAEKEPDCD